MDGETAQKMVSARGRILLGFYLAGAITGLSYFTAKLWPPVSLSSAVIAAPVVIKRSVAVPASGANGYANAFTGAMDRGARGQTGESGAAGASGPGLLNRVENGAKAPAEPDPSREAESGNLPEHTRTVRLFWGLVEFSMTPELRLILIVLATGALGGCIHCATSFIGYVGNDKLYTTWLWYYLLRAPISAALALITYFVLRGGLFTPASGTGDVNEFGVAAVSGLVGMFSRQATAKLNEIFTSLFRTAQPEPLADALANKAPVLAKVDPATIPHGADATITVTGDFFVNQSKVRWAGAELQTTFVKATELMATVPAAKLASPGSFEVTVLTPPPGGGTSPAVKVTVS